MRLPNKTLLVLCYIWNLLLWAGCIPEYVFLEFFALFQCGKETWCMTDRVGQQFGNYRLLRVLGQGTFASVYLGEHLYLERPAAIKILHVQMEPATFAPFQREARTIAQLHHPHIIGVYDFGIVEQTPYLVMEYAPGGTLRERYPKGTRLTYEQIITYVKQIA